MINLLEETQEAMKDEGLLIKDITFIGSGETGHQCSWNTFKKLANKEYDNGYGGEKVCLDLTIVFKCGTMMVRDTYDGSEWWDVIKPFSMPEERKGIKTLFMKGYNPTLAENN